MDGVSKVPCGVVIRVTRAEDFEDVWRTSCLKNFRDSNDQGGKSDGCSGGGGGGGPLFLSDGSGLELFCSVWFVSVFVLLFLFLFVTI
jgi:hypothetical protein